MTTPDENVELDRRYRYTPKINPKSNLEHITLEPSELALNEWHELGLELPNWSIIREYRLERVRHWLRKFDYTGIVLYDPLNVRYTTDTSNLQV